MNQYSRLYTFFFFVLCFTCIPKQAQAQCDPRRDSLALVDLFDSTGGNNWTNKTNWKVVGQPIGTWYGITTDAGGCVTCIDLDGQIGCSAFTGIGNNLVGILPLSLDSLKSLQGLYLSRNQLSGKIPYLSLSNLIWLDLSVNQLTNFNLPNFNLPNLQYFYLNNNIFSGSIPNFNLPNLLNLQLGANNLSGNLPNFNLPNLQVLTLNSNQISGIIPNFNLPKLQSLSITNNQLNGSIPNFNLPNLTSLILFNNKLTGTIPNFNLPKLEILQLYQNQLDSCSKFTNLTSLKKDTAFQRGLRNYRNRLTFDDILPNLALETSATFVYSPQDSIFKDTTYNKNILETLVINLGIDDTVTTNIYKWYKNNQLYRTITGSNKLIFNGLQALDAGVYRCEVTNSNAPLLTLLSRKATVILTTPSNCGISDSLELIKLYNSTNGANWTNKWDLTKPINTWYGVNVLMGCVETIGLSNNQLNGTIPNLNLPSLRYLLLQDNQLNGTIPNFNLPNLQNLVLNNNQLSGTIPNFNLPNLVYLSLFNNQLSGTIPNFSLPNLKELFLYNNQLIGNIPSFILLNLSSLYLSSNQLTGSIPNLNLPNLIALYVNRNQLSGNIPIIRAGVNFKCEVNKFTFQDLLPNLTPIAVKTYAPQDSIFKDTTYQNTEGSNLTINLGIDDTVTTNIYKWYKNGTLFRTVNGSNKLSFASLALADAGVYTCQVTNPNAPLLTLYSRKATVRVVSLCQNRDSLALVDLYNSTNGANWRNKWDLTKPINTWYGINVDANGCVTCIDLDGLANCSAYDSGGGVIQSGNNMKGIIPLTINNIENLTGLFLTGNQLSGTIPNFTLPNLQSLYLFKNQLTGAIPSFNLPKMSRLWLQNNQLSGGIPSFITPELIELYVDSNRLSSNINNFNLPKISVFWVKNNQFTFDKILSPIQQGTKTSVSFANYFPQDSIFKDTTYQNTERGSFSINLGVDDTVTTNIYKWFKNGTLYRTVNGSNKLVFPSLSLTDAGVYTCQITNPNAPLLTLNSRKATVNVKNCALIKTDAIDDNIIVNETNAAEFTVTDNDRFDATSQLNITLLKKPQYGTLTALGNGKFRYESLPILRGVTQMFTYLLCNTLCPNECDSAQVMIDIQGLSPVMKNSKGITPQNHDGKNDVLEFDETEDLTRYPESELIIYNRWNDIVFRAKPYLNNWDGSRNGQPLPAGTYYYILHLNQKEGKTLTGDVTIIR